MSDSLATLKPLTKSPPPQPGDSGFRHLFQTPASTAQTLLGTSAGSTSARSITPRADPPRLPYAGAGAPLIPSLSRQLSRPTDYGAAREGSAMQTRRYSRDLSPTGVDRANPESRQRRRPSASMGETTPLLSPERRDAAELPDDTEERDVLGTSPTSLGGRRRSSMARRPSGAQGRRVRRRSSVKGKRNMERGESTDGQTLFNAVAVLVGIGLLSLPLAFSYAGWIGGTIMLVGFAYITCHTAKLLARLIAADPSIRGYTDFGRRAFGSWAGGAISALFCLELFALGVALIVLFGDSLNVIFPSVSPNTFKLIGFFIVLPTALLPLRLLSLPSLLSSVSSLLLIIVILIDGFVKTTPPGSLLHPAKTTFGPDLTSQNWLGGIGLMLAGFGGHAVVPSLARDMRKPQNFTIVINKAFLIATILSLISGAAGYLMIGDDVSDEITRDIMQPKYGYPRWLNLVALWMIVINPLTKFGLCSRPLNVTIESLLNLSPTILLPPTASDSSYADVDPTSAFSHLSALSNISRLSDLSPVATPAKSPLSSAVAGKSPHSASALAPKPATSPTPSEIQLLDKVKSSERRRAVGRVISRTIVTAVCTATAIGLPGFGRVMAFLGSFSAFLICIILPLLFYIRLAPRMHIDDDVPGRRMTRVAHFVLVGVSVCLMLAGTVWAFLPGTGRDHG